MAALYAMQKLNSQYGVARIYINLGDLFNRQKKFSRALDYSMQGVTIAEEIGSKELLLIGYKNMALSYNALNNFKQGSYYLSKQLEVKDSIFEEESARSYAEMETRFQTERKAKEILLLQKENTIKNVALVAQQRAKYFLLIVLGLIGLVAVLLYRSALLKQRSNQSLGLLNAKLQESNHSKIKLLSILNHDLRSPVSNLFSFLHLKAEGAALSASAAAEHDRKITQAAEQLLDAMEDVLVWSKSQMEHFTPVYETISLSLFLDEILSLHATAASNKNIQLIKDCPDHLSFHTDLNFLKIIVRNLTSNAIKFTPQGGTVRLQAAGLNGTLLFTVKDNGPGINIADQQSLFEWNSIRSDSSGLGLKLAKEFTEKLKGTITIQSQPGEGTLFILSFPV
jgi:signal transduction histidine kinase